MPQIQKGKARGGAAATSVPDHELTASHPHTHTHTSARSESETNLNLGVTDVCHCALHHDRNKLESHRACALCGIDLSTKVTQADERMGVGRRKLLRRKLKQQALKCELHISVLVEQLLGQKTYHQSFLIFEQVLSFLLFC